MYADIHTQLLTHSRTCTYSHAPCMHFCTATHTSASRPFVPPLTSAYVHTQHTSTQNLIGSYRCTCDAGHVLNGDGRTCSDVDECLTDNGGCKANSKCANNKGGHTCPCNPGYFGDGKISCDACNTGSYQPLQAIVAVCTACPALTTTVAGAAGALDLCVCQVRLTSHTCLVRPQGQSAWMLMVTSWSKVLNAWKLLFVYVHSRKKSEQRRCRFRFV